MRKKIGFWLGMSVAVVLMMGDVVMTGCAAPEQPAEEPAATATEEQAEVVEVEYLYVHHAESVTLEDGVLTLGGVGEDILYFSDRPHRIVGRETIEEFLASWHEGEESFAEVPPNAVLTVKQEEELRDLTVVLKNPVLTDRTLVYEVEVLDGPDSGSGDFAALFIDVIVGLGEPDLGPASYRGQSRRVARRTARRTSRRMERREDYEEQQYAEQQYAEPQYVEGGQEYDETSELQRRLRELDELLAQGLITQQDYDREKKELLDQY